MKKGIVLIVFIVLFYVLFNNYIYTGTVEKALESVEGSGFKTIPAIDDDHRLVFIEKETGFVKAIVLSKGIFGWKNIDEVEIRINADIKGFNKKETSLHIGSGVNIQLIMAVVLDDNIKDIDIYAKYHTELEWNKTHSDNGTALYYWFGDEKLTELSYKAYAKNGQLLYEK